MWSTSRTIVASYSWFNVIWRSNWIRQTNHVLVVFWIHNIYALAMNFYFQQSSSQVAALSSWSQAARSVAVIRSSAWYWMHSKHRSLSPIRTIPVNKQHKGATYDLHYIHTYMLLEWTNWSRRTGWCIADRFNLCFVNFKSAADRTAQKRMGIRFILNWTIWLRRGAVCISRYFST